SHLGAVGAAIEMRLVKNEDEFFLGMRREIIARVPENLPLDRPQQHIFQHRIVGHEQIRTGRLNLMSGQKFGILNTLDGPQRLAVGVFPMLAWIAVPATKTVEGANRAVGLSRPASFLVQNVDKRLGSGASRACGILDL